MAISIDIETLGTRPGSAILSIGAVRFDIPDDPVKLGHAGETFYTEISVSSSLNHGFSIEPSTFQWWATQEDRELIFRGQCDVKSALTSFLEFAGEWETLWAKSPHFDLSIIEGAFSLLGADKPPFSFRRFRDVRTIAMLPVKIPKYVDIAKKFVAHHALNDALAQALTVQSRLC